MKQRHIYYYLLLISVSLITSAAFGQFNIDAQYRPRFEIRDGYRKLSEMGSAPAFIISQRTRLSFSYLSDNLKVFFTPQDIRVWGDENLTSSTGVFGNESSIDMFEGYAEIKLADMGWISVGRQQLVYDNQRLLAARNWNQNGITYDALLIKFKSHYWNFHIGSSWNSMNEALNDNFYWPNRIKTLNYAWLNQTLNQNLEISFLHIASGQTSSDQSNKLHFRQTSGIYAVFESPCFGITGSAYYQYGKNNYGNPLSALLFDADFHIKIRKSKHGIGFSYLSGNNKINGKTDHLFNVLYGARHSFFGHMDYFRDFETHTKQGGLMDFYFYLGYRISERLNLTNTGHYFRLAQTNPLTPIDKNLGYENEIMLNYKIAEWGSLKSGYLFYIPTNAFKILQGISTEKLQQFFYLELTIKTSLFAQNNNSI